MFSMVYFRRAMKLGTRQSEFQSLRDRANGFSIYLRPNARGQALTGGSPLIYIVRTVTAGMPARSVTRLMYYGNFVCTSSPAHLFR